MGVCIKKTTFNPRIDYGGSIKVEYGPRQTAEEKLVSAINRLSLMPDIFTLKMLSISQSIAEKHRDILLLNNKITVHSKTGVNAYGMSATYYRKVIT